MAGYNCLVWDWNGTLFDDLEVSVNAMNRVLEKYNLPLLDVSKYRDIFGFPVRCYYDHLGFDPLTEPFEKISDEFIVEYQKESLVARLNRDCRQVLGYIHNKGIKQVILSAAHAASLKEQVRYFGLLPYFDRLLGLSHSHATSKVAIGKRWLAESGFPKEDVLMVGDTLHDYEAARAMGCDCVLVAGGHQSRARIASAGVPVVETLGEVKGHL